MKKPQKTGRFLNVPKLCLLGGNNDSDVTKNLKYQHYNFILSSRRLETKTLVSTVLLSRPALHTYARIL